MGVLRPHWARPSQALPQLSVCRVNAGPRFKGNGLASPAVARACGTSYTPRRGAAQWGSFSPVGAWGDSVFLHSGPSSPPLSLVTAEPIS